MYINDLLNGYQDDVVIRTRTNPDGTSYPVVIEAGDHVTISRELMEQHDEQWMKVDGDTVTLVGEYTYRIDGANLRGDTLASLIKPTVMAVAPGNDRTTSRQRDFHDS